MSAKSADRKTEQLVVTALMMCLILVGTIVFRIPIPMTQGYVHLGDAMIFLGVLLLGKKSGATAAGLGSAMADVLGGFAVWAPWTLVIKAAMAYSAGALIDHSRSGGKSLSRGAAAAAMAVGGLIMTAGYYVAEGIMYGSWGAALIGIPWNIGQFVVGIVLSVAIYTATGKFGRSLKD